MTPPARRRATRGHAPAGLVLTPGASASRDQRALVAIDEAVSATGVRVERIDFPYRLAGRRAPDRPPVLIAAVTEAASSLAAELEVDMRRIAIGGRSMGGRMCSMAVAQGEVAAGALVLVSYPLHPPGKPDQLRDEHFDAIDVPCLFVSGTRDNFATTDELERATRSIRGPVVHHWIEGADHGLRRKDQEVATVVSEWLSVL